MTVSRTLRYPHLVREETRLRVEAAVAAVGYVPDPYVSIHMARLRRGSASASTANIAFVSTQTPEALHRSPFYRRILEACRQTAERAGYNIELFTVPKTTTKPRQITQILRARGVMGLIIAPLSVVRGHLSFEWKEFPSVTLGYSLTVPRIHRVCTHHAVSMLTTIRKLRKLGYQRIGCCLREETDRRMDNIWQATYLMQMSKRPSESMPVFLRAKQGQGDFLKWLNKHKPDALIGSDQLFHEWMLGAGIQIPQNIAFASLALHQTPGWTASGTGANLNGIASAAVDLLITNMQNNQRGIPASPHTVLIEPLWNEGTTAPAKRRISVSTGRRK